MKKVIWLLELLCILFIVSSCSKPALRARNVIIYENDGSTEDIVLENESLELRFLPRTAEIVLTDKAGGSQWRSNPPVEIFDPLADTVTRYLMNSQFSVEYADVSGVGMTLYSGEQSVDLGAYSYEIVDGGLEVNYTVGNLDRTYIIPPAVPEERMIEILEGMGEGDRSLVISSYRLYDINNLRQNDNRTELLALYPDLVRRKVYVLRPDTRDYQKAESEELFTAAGYTYDDYLEDIAYYPSISGREKPAFNITFRYTLEGKTLVLNVPFDKIAYRTAYPITRLTLMPYMGAGGAADEGYLLVPDGSGALIYFNNGRYNQITYSDNVYGWDEGMFRDAVVNDNKAPFPAFGIQRNGTALFCVIENGASYASIRADVSGRNSSWNNVYSRFDMIHSAKMDISTRSERAVYLYERNLPEGENITLRYTVCDQDGYMGMAKEYRKWLLDKYPSLSSNLNKESGIPVAVEIPGAVNKTQHRLGIPFDLPLKLTSYKEMEGMIRDFADLGWKNVRIKLNGWFNRSVEHSIPTKVKLIRELGNKRDFLNITAAAKDKGYTLYPEADFFYMKDKKPFDGFSLYRDASRYVNRNRIEKYPYSFVWFGERVKWGKLSYIARPVKMMSMIDDFVKKAETLQLKSVAFRNIGAKLAGDYNERRIISREASMRMRQEKLAELDKSDVGILLNTGFMYAVPWADFITDIAVDDQSFGITDVSIPFYEIVLHGLVPYTSRAINLAEDYTKNLLKTIESGAGLYFSFITEETAILQETKFRQFYANEYHKWVGDADALYKKFAADFTGLYNQAIINHAILSPNVTATTYEDGTVVIVNYSNAEWNYQISEGRSIVVQADNYVVLR